MGGLVDRVGWNDGDGITVDNSGAEGEPYDLMAAISNAVPAAENDKLVTPLRTNQKPDKP